MITSMIDRFPNAFPPTVDRSRQSLPQHDYLNVNQFHSKVTYQPPLNVNRLKRQCNPPALRRLARGLSDLTPFAFGRYFDETLVLRNIDFINCGQDQDNKQSTSDRP